MKVRSIATIVPLPYLVVDSFLIMNKYTFGFNGVINFFATLGYLAEFEPLQCHDRLHFLFEIQWNSANKNIGN